MSAPGDGQEDPAPLPGDLVGHYRGMLRAAEAAPNARTRGTRATRGGPDDTATGEPDLTDGGIADRLTATRAALHEIVRRHLGDDPALHEIAERIAATGDRALRLLRDGDEPALRGAPAMIDSLETIVRTDGSRPSFMIRNGAVDLSTSPVGSWAETLAASADVLTSAIACVGRIDVPGVPQGFAGTGFLIQENLIVTNRHVLQMAATREDDGSWTLTPGATIDFGHEFRAKESLNPRRLKRVVFTGAKPIAMAGPVDHTKLDLALIELEAGEAGAASLPVLAVDKAPDWPQPDLALYAIGYPATPPVGAFTPSLLEQLFKSTFGCKRLAPGLITLSGPEVHTWTASHDATTLGGNSGSALLVVGRERAAAGLHYGGRSRDLRVNWGHVLGLVLDERDGVTETTLREVLTARGVRLIDRFEL